MNQRFRQDVAAGSRFREAGPQFAHQAMRGDRFVEAAGFQERSPPENRPRSRQWLPGQERLIRRWTRLVCAVL
jgi:hypothetical protein